MQFWKSFRKTSSQKSEYGLLKVWKRDEDFFAWKTYFNPYYFFANKMFNFDETFEKCHWGSGTIHPEVRNLLKMIHFFKTNFPSFCSTGGKSALLTELPHSFRHETEKCLLKSGNGWIIGKKSNTSVFPQKDPLARRVQFFKPCTRKISRKWNWINQNRKKTNKFAQFSQEKITGKRSLDTGE